MRLSVQTEEQIVRARDRMRVQYARRGGRPVLLFLLLIGPGILTMLGENDGPSMISYAATGANYGVGFFVPIILLTFVMAYIVQEAAMRIGIATQRGHAELIRERFGKVWAFLTIVDLTVGNILTLVGEFVAVASGAAFFGIAPALAVSAAFAITLMAFATRRYFTWERFVLVLALGNLVFIPVALRAHPQPAAILTAIALWRPFPNLSMGFLTLVLANVGATVTPWMIFFQQSAVVDKGLSKADLRHARIDTALGAMLAACVAIATLCIGAILYAHNVGDASLRGGANFASTLLPYLGRHASALFALGMIEAGMTATVTISLSSGYAAGELLRAGKSLNRGFSDGRLFYGIIVVSLLVAAGIVLVPKAPLFTLAIMANVAATVFMAPTLIFLLLLARDRNLMGDLVNGRFASAACTCVTVAICLLSAMYGAALVFTYR
jgi:Mn2+/Fe2+ NRAMP family transporter